MRNLTVCMIAFAVAFSICGLAFRFVVAANGKTGQDPAAAYMGSPRSGGIPGALDDELY